MSDYKNITWYWALVVCLGFSIITSFGSLKFIEFDWKYMIVVIIYFVFSEIIFNVIGNIFVNMNGNVIEARKIKFKCYEIIDNNNCWEKLSLISLYEKIIISCIKAYYIFRGQFKRTNTNIIQENDDSDFVSFRNKFIRKELSGEYLRSNRISLIKRIKILRLQKNQDNESCWENEYLRFKTGGLIPSSLSKYLYNTVSIILSIVPLCITIVVTINIVPSETFAFRLALLGIIFIADLVSMIVRIKIDIKQEVKSIGSYNKTINDYVYNDNFSFLNTITYFRFYGYKVPDDFKKRKYNLGGLLDEYRDNFYDKHAYIINRIDL